MSDSILLSLLEHDTPNEVFPHNFLDCARYKLGTILVLHQLDIVETDIEPIFGEILC